MHRRTFLARTSGSFMAGALAPRWLVTPELMARQDDLMDAVRWIIDTPRSEVLERAAAELRKGLTQEQLLAATYLAAIEEVRPHPVGFKFHAVMVVHPMHQVISLVPEKDRVVPLLWCLDTFKRSQADDASQGDWKLGPAPTKDLPAPDKAAEALRRALDAWDPDASDRAATALASAGDLETAFDTLFEYGCRCWNDIGHKAIYTAMCYRTLKTIGWQHGVPALRSLVAAMLDAGKGPDAEPFQASLEIAARVPADWEKGRDDPDAARDILKTLCNATPSEASAAAAGWLRKGTGPSSLWDGIVASAAEVVMQGPAVVPLHAMTVINSCHFIARRSRNAKARLLALLQASAWIPLFWKFLADRDQLRAETPRIHALEPEPLAEGKTPVAKVLGEDRSDRHAAARRALTLANDPALIAAYMSDARTSLVARGHNVHQYKFGAAIMEEIQHVSAPYGSHILAASALHLPDPRAADPQSLRRVRHALG